MMLDMEEARWRGILVAAVGRRWREGRYLETASGLGARALGRGGKERYGFGRGDGWEKIRNAISARMSVEVLNL